jgi:hypothetical protein
MSLDDDLRRSLPSQQALRAMSESVQALQKSVSFGVLEGATRVGAVGQIMTDAQWRSLRGVIHDALPKIDVSQIAGFAPVARRSPGVSGRLQRSRCVPRDVGRWSADGPDLLWLSRF